ncbi:Bug family tripartite tricarboxylate transporter substrate binding protein [Aquabacterium sp. OR-4]|uniref:Bug family tripartite tricarboxylate transporter substrate binding protein n=1 Tax=Aquabacterium sp. OR-4 TaxID=2978127 RepID=UPI0028C6DFCB|nr:tripartite tricarboxylate transporter substrate-binding protein [Aquabacterium sp. OR-4]MDT7838981.1 tripartite tricarboxylate transporter substrate-binding protein [Aquabacterium sp. OR-4]
MISRRSALQQALALGAATSPWAPARAEVYPAKPISLYVAFAPGGAADIVARLVGKEMGKSLGQPVVVENRPAPMVAVTSTQRARPDGHTLMVAGSGTALSSALFKSLPYDLMKDFVHVSTLASFDLVLITGEGSPLRSVAEVLALARSKPGALTIGSARIGSTQNLAAEMFKAMTGIDALIVPFKTTAEILTGLRSGDVHVAFEMLPPVLTQIRARSVRPLAVSSATRFAGLPQLPTLAESGVPGYEAASWNGISAPAGTPAAVIERLNRAVQQAVATPEVQRELQAAGMVAQAGTPEQMSQRMRADMAKWRAVIERAGIEKQ